MRYQDWDVLLFPAGEEGAHVPIKEFKTACYVEQPESNGHHATPIPLLTTFIPSLQRNAPFQISVHSWVKTVPLLGPLADGSKAKELWQARVVVDGECVSTRFIDNESVWPHIICTHNLRFLDTSSASSPSVTRQSNQLQFPPFHREIMSQSHWNAADRVGRIRVELSAVYVPEGVGRYVKLRDIVIFAFQPAPLELLEHSGVAWPNTHMFMNPLQANRFHNVHAPNAIMPAAAKHKRVASTSNINSTTPMFGDSFFQRPASPSNPITHDMNSNYDASSRSTSAYSVMGSSAAPLLMNPTLYAPTPAYPTIAHPDGTRQQVKVRLPSDQIQMIISALQPAPQTHEDATRATAMPPPPLPQHAQASKVNVENVTTTNGSMLPPFGSDVINFIDRRAESRHSDVSMHNNCDSFPSCTTEDAEGHVVHNPPAAPATVVRGRKEGSSPTKPRDFFSTILDTPADRPTSVPEMSASMETGLGLVSSSPVEAQGKKRARSALKSLNINDGGSPEKKDTTKPPRKASRASISSNTSNKENALEGHENMVLDT
ncbi:hypothetical protein LTR37_001867 [Vermiconidia calcicola]|uniref:Uncharacterized protein n=1 Tax=Vermiconidia calcicola TaxID=1690605 RepID=A0ACC3NWT5_9PEZI|nr:hypothetical protein LTR37_001867 [Vermiconidia calcicola]